MNLVWIEFCGMVVNQYQLVLLSFGLATISFFFAMAIIVIISRWEVKRINKLAKGD